MPEKGTQKKERQLAYRLGGVIRRVKGQAKETGWNAKHFVANTEHQGQGGVAKKLSRKGGEKWVKKVSHFKKNSFLRIKKTTIEGIERGVSQRKHSAKQLGSKKM